MTIRINDVVTITYANKKLVEYWLKADKESEVNADTLRREGSKLGGSWHHSWRFNVYTLNNALYTIEVYDDRVFQLKLIYTTEG